MWMGWLEGKASSGGIYISMALTPPHTLSRQHHRSCHLPQLEKLRVGALSRVGSH
jgi:hypothetical protein